MLDCLTNLHARRTGQVQKTVILADEPRDAALRALEHPCQGVTLAGYALAAGVDAERQRQVTCVDLYFEGVAFSWHFLQSPGASARPEYSAAWQYYHLSLARVLAAAQRFGRLDPTRGLRVMTAVGAIYIPTYYQGFVWRSADFTRVEVVQQGTPQRLKNHYACPGLGVPLVVVRENQQPDRFLNNETTFNATAVLRPSLAVLAGQAPPLGAESSHGPLELYDPLRVNRVKFQNASIAMATDTSAALEYAIRSDTYNAWDGFVRPESAEPGREKLFLLEPYQAGKYPVVFVHGFLSSPRIWAQFANEILARPDLRKHIQLMAYRYPTGRPFPESAQVLRSELLTLKETFDPRGEDPGIANTAVVGHSMGGLVAKMLATYSDDRLWYSVANRPLNEINASPAERQRLHDLFYFEPVPFVRRVVFMGAPHDGAQLASRTIGRWSASCVREPSSEQIAHHLLIQQNPGVFKPELEDRIPTSIDLMQPDSCLLRTLRVLSTGPNVQLHNIVGTGCFSPLSGCGDGVVARRSAQHHSVSTEKQIHTTHGGLHERDEAIRELACILQRHIWEANDLPSVDGYEFAVPEQPPVYVVPDTVVCPDECFPEDLCPELMCPEDLCPEILCPELIGPLELDPCLLGAPREAGTTILPPTTVTPNAATPPAAQSVLARPRLGGSRLSGEPPHRDAEQMERGTDTNHADNDDDFEASPGQTMTGGASTTSEGPELFCPGL